MYSLFRLLIGMGVSKMLQVLWLKEIQPCKMRLDLI